MRPINNQLTEIMLGGEGFQTLPVKVEGDYNSATSVKTSYWSLSPDEIERLKHSPVIALSVYGASHPPVRLQPIFDEADYKGDKLPFLAVSPLQDGIDDWLAATFEQSGLYDKRERCFRFMEEAIEFVQSCGVEKEDCQQLLDYVYSKEPGIPEYELGDALFCLSAAASALKLSLSRIGKQALARNWVRQAQIKAKFGRRKNLDNPLPVQGEGE